MAGIARKAARKSGGAQKGCAPMKGGMFEGERKAIAKEVPLAARFIENSVRKREKSHPLCGKRIRFAYTVFGRKGDRPVACGKVDREASVFAVREGLWEVVCLDNAEVCYIPPDIAILLP